MLQLMIEHVVTERAPVVGFVGAGQLARMTLPAAIPLDIEIRLLAESVGDSAALVGKRVEIGRADAADDLGRIAAMCDVLTFDHELVNADALRSLAAAGHIIRPSAGVVALVQDKEAQRQLMRRLGLPIPDFEIVSDLSGIEAFGDAQGWPVVAKAIRGGYDGRGVWMLQDPDAARSFFEAIGSIGSFLVEEWVPIEREVAVLIARRPNGDSATFPVVETVQIDGICRDLVAPAPVPDSLKSNARTIAIEIAKAIQLEGLLAVELFVTDGRLIVNELAARPHNSGHFTIEGCRTSQFAQHLRAILDWPLGDTRLTAPAVATVNLLGGPVDVDPRAKLSRALELPNCYPHLYGKGYRPGRKLGHVTALGDDPEETMGWARRCAAILTGEEE